MPEGNEIRNWLQSEWASQLGDVLESMAGEKPELEWKDSQEEEQNITLGWEQPLNCGPDGVFWVGAGDAAWKTIAGKVLAAAGVEDASGEDLRSTYTEVLSQANSATAQKLGQRLGREVVTTGGQEVSAAPGGTSPQTLLVRFSGAPGVAVQFTAGLGVEGLFRAAAPLEPDQAPAAPPPGNTPGSRTLDLLLEVELPVSVSFGRAQLPLKDVLKLTTGSIVELNRSIVEPVEIIVNNCVIARGEVVVIEGNYGVRITQVINRQERLRTLN
jgi:flagellar motor switch protein FliN/FliY